MEVFLAPDRKIWKFRYNCDGDNAQIRKIFMTL